MSAADPIGATIVDPLLKRLYDYWDKERGSAAMPPRRSIDPIKMRYILGHLMLVDVTDNPRRFRIRLQGTELTWWIGADLTGKTLEDLPSSELRALGRDYFESVISARAPDHRLGTVTLDGLARSYEALILPLSVSGPGVDLILLAVRCRQCRTEDSYGVSGSLTRV